MQETDSYFHPIEEKPNPGHINSWYAASANRHTDYPALAGEQTADVCVLGSGTTGISAALFLAEKGYSVIVLESEKIGWGASGRNGGQFIIGFSCSMSKIKSLVGESDAKILFDQTYESINLVKNLVREHKISCDLREGQLTVGYPKKRHDEEIKGMITEFEKLNFGQHVRFLDNRELKNYVGSDVYGCGIRDSFSGHLHPLNFTLGLAEAAEKKNVRFFEKSEIKDVQSNQNGVVVKTANGSVKAKNAILAGNAYLKGFSPLTSRIMPVGTYIAATEPLSEEECRSLIPEASAIADINFVLDYYRLSSNRRMLFGGRVSYSGIDPISIRNSIRSRMVSVFPQLKTKKIDYSWGGNVAVTMNRAPHFGKLKKNIYFAQGFSGHGVSLTVQAGKLLSEVVAGEDSKFALFEKIKHMPFPGGTLLRKPSLVLGMLYYRIRDLL